MRWLLPLMLVLGCTSSARPNTGETGPSTVGAPTSGDAGGGARPGPVGSGSQAGAGAVHDGGMPQTGADASVCDVPPVPGQLSSCCAGSACLGVCRDGGVCDCEGQGSGPCLEGKVCCGSNNSGACVYPDTCTHLALVPGDAPGTFGSVCNGDYCHGWCEWLPDGTKECNCWGIIGGCQKGTCSKIFQGCK